MKYKFLFQPKNSRLNKVAFLDRDGVINIDYSYVYSKNNFVFIDGALKGLRLLHDKGFHLILVTNQSGIGRGKYSMAQFRDLCFWLAGRMLANASPLTAIYFCPHHPTQAEVPFKINCDCRKPAPGMILEAIKDFDINLNNCILIGDKDSDIQAGKRAGIKNRFLVADHRSAVSSCMPTFIGYKNLYEVAQSL